MLVYFGSRTVLTCAPRAAGDRRALQRSGNATADAVLITVITSAIPRPDGEYVKASTLA